MYNKGGEDLYYKLSRKELQSWCKKCGLPARKSTAEMAESLRSYFLRKNLSLLSSGIGLSQGALLPTSLVPTLQPEAPENFMGDHVTAFGLRSYPREEVNKGNISLTCNELESHLTSNAYDKEQSGGPIDTLQGASQFRFVSRSAGSWVKHKEPSMSSGGRMEDVPPPGFHHRDVNMNGIAKDNTAPCVKTSTKVPASFEFYVSSDEGVKLCVDLNSSPLDWINKYRNQVFVCENVGNSRSQSLHQELGRCIGKTNKQKQSSLVWSADPVQIKDDLPQTEPSPSSVMEKDISRRVDYPNEADKSLMSSPILPCIVDADVSECLQKDKEKPNPDVPNEIISNSACCTKKGSVAACLSSNIADSPIEKTACNFAVNSTSDGSVDLVALELQNSKVDDEGYENSTLQNSCSVENTSTAFPGCLASHSTKKQLSEIGNCPKSASCSPLTNHKCFDLDGSRKNIGSEHNALANSCENDPCGNHLPTFSEEQEWSNIVNGRESSVCSQVDNSIEETGLRSGKVELNEEYQQKRPRADTEGQNGCLKRDVKLLRSMKHSSGDVTPRRSMRLVSKVLF